MSDSEQRLDWHDPDEFDDWGDFEEEEDNPPKCERCKHLLTWDGVFWHCPVHGYKWMIGGSLTEIPDE